MKSIAKGTLNSFWKNASLIKRKSDQLFLIATEVSIDADELNAFADDLDAAD